MFFEFKVHEIFKQCFIFSVLLFLLSLYTVSFSDVLSVKNQSFESRNGSNLSSNSFKNFIHLGNTTNNTSTIQNQTIKNIQKIKIVAAGDFGCRPIAQNNIKQIELQKPDLFLVIGDLSYEPTMDCWYNMTKLLDS